MTCRLFSCGYILDDPGAKVNGAEAGYPLGRHRAHRGSELVEGRGSQYATNDANVIDSGGWTFSTGGGYTLGSTIGQPASVPYKAVRCWAVYPAQ